MTKIRFSLYTNHVGSDVEHVMELDADEAQEWADMSEEQRDKLATEYWMEGVFSMPGGWSWEEVE